MDWFSLLSDDLLIKILSLVRTRDAITTSFLSKRWYSLWKYVPTLRYCDPSIESEYWRASRFVDKFLLQHKAPVLDTIHLTLSRHCSHTDMETWIRIAVSRGVRDLQIRGPRPGLGAIRLPSVLFTCETIVSLYLQPEIIVDHLPLTVCLRSLKVLILYFASFSSDEIVRRFLSGCPVLVDLKVLRDGNDNVKTFTIDVPSLQSLTISDYNSMSLVPEDDAGFVIIAPSLESLTIANQFRWRYSWAKMPNLVMVDIKVQYGDYVKFKECIISAKYISLCLEPPPMGSLPIGIFKELVCLNLCTCSLDWCRLILSNAPKLRVLRFRPKHVRLNQIHQARYRCCTSSINVQTHWEQPSSVPQCLISSLETVEWTDYKGTEAETKVAKYLRENCGQLKRMAIKSSKSANDKEKFEMLKELWSVQRGSSNCWFSFT